MVAFPQASAVTFPVASTAATVAASLPHVPDCVAEEPSERLTLAENWTVSPIRMKSSPGVMVTLTAVGVGLVGLPPPPPPHAVRGRSELAHTMSSRRRIEVLPNRSFLTRSRERLTAREEEDARGRKGDVCGA